MLNLQKVNFFRFLLYWSSSNCNNVNFFFNSQYLANCCWQIAGSWAASRGKEYSCKQDERQIGSFWASKAHRRRYCSSVLLSFFWSNCFCSDFYLFFNSGKNLKEALITLEEDLIKLRDELQLEAQCIPNMTHPDVPIGGEESSKLRNMVSSYITLISLLCFLVIICHSPGVFI